MFSWDKLARGVLCDVFGAGSAVGGIAAAAGNVAAAGIQASASRDAAKTQAEAAKYAADLSSNATANSLAFNQTVWGTDQANQQPYISAGQDKITALANETNPSGGELVNGYDQSFNAPTPFDGGPAFSFSGVNESTDPAYQFNLQQQQAAIQRSAAAQGGLISGGAMKDLADYTQGNALNAYQTDFNTALGGYQTNFGDRLAAHQNNYSDALQQYQNAYNVWTNNQANAFNRQATVAGIGQVSANQLGQNGSAAAANYSNTALTGAANQGNFLTQSAVAQSAGTMGVANAWAGGLNGAINSLASGGNSGSSYGMKNQFAWQNSDMPTASVSPGQWAGYDAGSTPAGYRDA